MAGAGLLTGEGVVAPGASASPALVLAFVRLAGGEGLAPARQRACWQWPPEPGPWQHLMLTPGAESWAVCEVAHARVLQDIERLITWAGALGHRCACGWHWLPPGFHQALLGKAAGLVGAAAWSHLPQLPWLTPGWWRRQLMPRLQAAARCGLLTAPCGGWSAGAAVRARLGLLLLSCTARQAC
jgi:hypothetical protein